MVSVPAGAAVKERPILFLDEMVRAILDGRKTQTRRVVRADRHGPWVPHLDEAHADPGLGDGGYLHVPYTLDGERVSHRVRCPYGAPGDRLWVREAFALSIRDPDSAFEPDTKDPSCWDGAAYRATYSGGDWEHRYENGRLIRVPPPWRPSIHMPRWASRITLEVTAVRVERLQAITEEDACAEGCTPLQMDHGSYLPTFEGLWDRINGKRHPWASNPWVWVVNFRRVS